jgi:hypothetical protein
MNLERAILLVLSASRRPLSAQIVTSLVPQFIGGDYTISDVERALKVLESKGHTKGTWNEDFGTLWKETDEGRLRIS